MNEPFDPLAAERCAEGYVNGIDCPRCEHASRAFVNWLTVAVLLLVVAIIWQVQS